MSKVVKNMKLHIYADNQTQEQFAVLTKLYADACSFVSQYVFDNGFVLNFMRLQEAMYHEVRNRFGLKSQFAISVMKTVTARYKTIREQMKQNPYKYCDEDGKQQYISKNLEWLQKPIVFRRPQADFVRGRDYSFVTIDGTDMLSLNTMQKRVRVTFDIPENFREELKGVSFSEDNLSHRTNADRQKLRTWAFYQLEQMLTYKAHEAGSEVLKVKADYTSQRCPKCGRIHKPNRHHDIHEYICDCCGYRSNDDRVGAINIQLLGTMYLSGDTNPRFGVRKTD